MSLINHLSSTNDCPLWYFIVLIISVPFLYFITKKSIVSFLIPYVFLIIGETLIFRTVSIEPDYEFELFWSYKEWSKYWFEITANIVAFIPLGFMLYKLCGRKGILFAFLFSTGIECIQLAAHRGLFELDDIFNNVLGTIIGCITYIIFKEIKKRKLKGKMA